ncbi:hypothetical protein BSKO_13108 [Bryopsis sp. KO-2023]|nr:hypothetical protein BSKO_13108 [Bryopsis sp. KO-2023]
MSSWLKAAEEFLDGSEQPQTPPGAKSSSLDFAGNRETTARLGGSPDYKKSPLLSGESHGGNSHGTAFGLEGQKQVEFKSLRKSDGDKKFGLRRDVSDAGLKQEVEKTIKDMQSRQTEENPREARLLQVCEQLRGQVANLKDENAKLEGRLRDANSRAKKESGQAESLEKELHDLDASSSRREATLQAEVVAKDLEINKINGDLEAAKKWGLELQDQVAALRETNQQLLEDHQADQGRMMEALRDQLADAERLLEQERGEHGRVSKSAGIRETELQQELTDSAGALAKMQRQLDERNSRVNDLEARVSSLVGELHRASSPALVTANAGMSDRALEIESLEQQLMTANAKIEDDMHKAKMANDCISELSHKVEMLEQQLSSAPAQASSTQLEDRLKEVTELLYQKQTQYERLASEKASQHLTMERQLQIAQDQITVLKTRVDSVNRTHSSGNDTVIPMDSLGEAFYNLANHKRVGRAVRTGALFVDNTASKLVFLLRQYPLWRVGVFLYIVFIHLYCYLLISRMQRQAVVSLEKPQTGGP